MGQEIFTLKQFSTRSVNPHVPGKQSCGKAIRSMSFGTVTSSVSGAFCSPLRLLTFSTLGLSFFFRKDRRLLLFKLLPALIIWTSSLLINGGTNTERTSGSRGGRFLSFLWVPYIKKTTNKTNTKLTLILICGVFFIIFNPSFLLPIKLWVSNIFYCFLNNWFFLLSFCFMYVNARKMGIFSRQGILHHSKCPILVLCLWQKKLTDIKYHISSFSVLRST